MLGDEEVWFDRGGLSTLPRLFIIPNERRMGTMHITNSTFLFVFSTPDLFTFLLTITIVHTIFIIYRIKKNTLRRCICFLCWKYHATREKVWCRKLLTLSYNVIRGMSTGEMKFVEWALFMTRLELVGTRETVNLWPFISQDGGFRTRNTFIHFPCRCSSQNFSKHSPRPLLSI